MIDSLGRLWSEPGGRYQLPLGSPLWYHAAMAKTTRDITQPNWQPTKGTGTPVMVRLQPDAISRLDEWRRAQDDLPSRAEALRRLAELRLAKGEPPAKPKKKG